MDGEFEEGPQLFVSLLPNILKVIFLEAKDGSTVTMTSINNVVIKLDSCQTPRGKKARGNMYYN